MDAIEQRYYDDDHAEAMVILRQLAVAPEGTKPDDVIALNRLAECLDDGEGHDLGKRQRDSLKALDLIEVKRGGWTYITDAGDKVRALWFDCNVEDAKDTP